MILHDIHRVVLAKALELTRRFEATPEPRKNVLPSFRRAWEEAKENGVAYKPSEWFNATTDAAQTNYRRAVYALEHAGLLVATVSVGGRMTHLKLTPEGRRQAEAVAV